MSKRIETFTANTPSDNKWSKNQTISAKESGVDIEKDVVDKEGCYIDDDFPSDITTFSGNKINRVAAAAAEGIVNDEEASESTTYSSAKIEELIAAIPTGSGSITRVTANPMSSSTVSTSVTVEKED